MYLVVIGYKVYASIEGTKKMVPISRLYHSENAADEYRKIALQQGFKDAVVRPEEKASVGPLGNDEAKERKKTTIKPKVDNRG